MRRQEQCRDDNAVRKAANKSNRMNGFGRMNVDFYRFSSAIRAHFFVVCTTSIVPPYRLHVAQQWLNILPIRFRIVLLRIAISFVVIVSLCSGGSSLIFSGRNFARLRTVRSVQAHLLGCCYNRIFISQARWSCFFCLVRPSFNAFSCRPVSADNGIK